jgi:hypothetical protein
LHSNPSHCLGSGCATAILAMTVGLLYRLLGCAKPHSTAIASSSYCSIWHVQKEFPATQNFCKITSIFRQVESGQFKEAWGHSARLPKTTIVNLQETLRPSARESLASVWPFDDRVCDSFWGHGHLVCGSISSLPRRTGLHCGTGFPMLVPSARIRIHATFVHKERHSLFLLFIVLAALGWLIRNRNPLEDHEPEIDIGDGSFDSLRKAMMQRVGRDLTPKEELKLRRLADRI